MVNAADRLSGEIVELVDARERHRQIADAEGIAPETAQRIREHCERLEMIEARLRDLVAAMRRSEKP